MPTTDYHEDLLDQYPQPLAAIYARYLDQPDTTAQHGVLLALFEALLKYAAVAALAQYLHDGGDDPALPQTLTGLRRPSLGHWAGLLRQILAYRRQHSLPEDTFVFPELARLYARPAPELQAGAALLRALEGKGHPVISARQLCDALVEYRNRQAHGAGQSAADLVPRLQAALEELLLLVPSLARRDLLYLDRPADDAPDLIAMRLMGDQPRLRPRPYPPPEPTAPPAPQQLYLALADGPGAPLPLHPLLVFVPRCAECGTPQVGVLNGAREKSAEYLCYGCGHANTLPALAADVGAFLGRFAIALPPEPERPTYTVPHNLPVLPNAFIGREQEVAAVSALLRRPEVHLVTLTGPGGTGKTRLALAVAEGLLDVFPDGGWFVDLAPLTDPALVASTIAAVLGVKETAGQPLLAALKADVAAKQMLLVLDNFEHLLAAASLVTDLLKGAPALKVLVTSRSPLDVYGEREYPVPPLGLPDPHDLPPLEQLREYAAVRLFLARAQEVKPDFALTDENAPTIAAICARLDGLPLAIELAAARVRLFTLPALLERLDSRLQVLTGGARDHAARQQTLRGTIAWSYSLLAPGEQQLFRRLAVFQGGCTLAATEAICTGGARSGAQRAPRDQGSAGLAQLPPDPRPLPLLDVDVLEGLDSLVRQSLAQQREGREGEPRFAMLETIHEYAQEQLAGSEVADLIQRRHADFFLQLAEEAAPQLHGPAQLQWFARLETEHDNLRAALGWSIRSGAVPHTLRLVLALAYFWWVRGHLSEGRKWLEDALLLVPPGGTPTIEQGRALYWAAALCFLLGDVPAMQAYATQSVAMLRELGDETGLAWALAPFAIALLMRGEGATALAYLEESAALFRRHGDNWGLASTLLRFGIVLNNQRKTALARTRLEEALALFRALGDLWGTAQAVNMLGDIARMEEDYKLAERLYSESLSLYRELGNMRDIAASLHNLGHVAAAQGDYGRAKEFFGESMALHLRLDNKQGVAESQVGLAGLAAAEGQPERAARLFGASAGLYKTTGPTMWPAERAAYERNLATARAQLDESAWAAAYAEGQAMPPEQATAYALEH